jgi:hypothetical protein
MFQFGNLANPRFNKGECSEKTKRRKGKKVNAKVKNDSFISSLPSRVSAPNAGH